MAYSWEPEYLERFGVPLQHAPKLLDSSIMQKKQCNSHKILVSTRDPRPISKYIIWWSSFIKLGQVKVRTNVHLLLLIAIASRLHNKPHQQSVQGSETKLTKYMPKSHQFYLLRPDSSTQTQHLDIAEKIHQIFQDHLSSMNESYIRP